MSRTFLYCIILSFVLGACSIFGSDTNKEPEELVPLNVGNYWDYHRWYLTPNIADTIREEIIGRHEIEIAEQNYTVFGYRQFLYQQQGDIAPNSSVSAYLKNNNRATPTLFKDNFSQPDYQWLRANDEGGLVSFGGLSPTDTLALRMLQYKYPGEPGDQLEYPTLSYDFNVLQFTIQDTITIETIGTNETFDSEWATYKGCFVYRFREIGQEDAIYVWDHYIYIKPGTGVVAVETIQLTSDIPNDLIGQWILIDYQLN